MYPLPVIATETADAVAQTVESTPNPFLLALGIAIAIGTCIGIAVSTHTPALVRPIANVRIKGDLDEVDQSIQVWFTVGFGLSLAVLIISRNLSLGAGVILLFFLFWFMGALIGEWFWNLFRVVVLQRVRRHRLLDPWIMIRRLHCQECRQPLQLLASSASPEQLLNYLSPVERMAKEETQFAVWHCPSCYPEANPGQVHLRGYRHSQTLICPQCQETTLNVTDSHRDWQGDSEYQVTTFVCRYCSTKISHSRFIQGGDPS